MRTRSLLSLATFGLTLLCGARTAQAQPSAWAAPVRPVATYDLRVALPDRTLPARVVVADSAGSLVASYRRSTDAAATPLGVLVEGADLVLYANGPQGPLEFVLRGQNARQSSGRLTGRWTFGQQQGMLYGRVRG